MIPSIHGKEEKRQGTFQMPKDRIGYTGPDEMFAVLEERLRGVAGYEQARLVNAAGGSVPALIEADIDPRMTENGYQMVVERQGIRITAGSRPEIAHGLTTLFWKICESGGEFECGLIEDRPVYGHRGYLIDSSRHFFDAETVKSMIEQGALRKLNRLHWHLSDDQGYRIESRRFPELNTVGSWRKEPDGSVYGGFYTWEQIRDVQDYAAARGVEVIPEIDLPGHVCAMIAAYPELSCSGEPLEIPAVQGIYERVLCVGKDRVMDFVRELLDEVCSLFSSRYFHIGGDEVPKVQWKACPHCQERIRREGLNGEEELQMWFTEEMISYLEKKGKTGICWNETLKSGKLSSRVIIHYWNEEGKGERYCDKAFRDGRKCIYSNSYCLYLDYIPALTPMRNVFFSEPVLRSGSRVPEESVLGCEAALWAERIKDRKRLEEMAFPRVFAMAERAWSGNTDYADFTERCGAELERLDRAGIAHMTMEEADPRGERQKQAAVDAYRQIIKDAELEGTADAQAVYSRSVRSRLKGMFAPEEIEEVINRIVRGGETEKN